MKAISILIAMAVTGCATTDNQSPAQISDLKHMNAGRGAKSYKRNISYYGYSAEIRIYESNDEIYILTRDKANKDKQVVNKLIIGEAINTQIPSGNKSPAIADEYMQKYRASLVFSGALVPGGSIHHGKSLNLGIEYHLKSYQIGSQGGNIQIEYIDHREQIENSKKAISERNPALLPQVQLTKGLPFFLTDFAEKNIDIASNSAELENIKKVIEKIGVNDQSLLCLIERRQTEIKIIDLSLQAKTNADLRYLNIERSKNIPNCFISKSNEITLIDPFNTKRKSKIINQRIIRGYTPEQDRPHPWPKNKLNDIRIKLGESRHLIINPKSDTVADELEIGIINATDVSPMRVRTFDNKAMAATERKVNLILNEAEKLAFSQKIESLRSQKNFRGYWDAYLLTKDSADIRSAYQTAITSQEKSMAEKGIVLALPTSRIFDVKITDRTDTPLRTGKSAGIFHSTKAQVKDIKRKITISVRKNIPFEIKHADYQITLKFKEMLDFTPPINGKDNDFMEKSITFNLNKNNNWKSEEYLIFQEIPVSGTVRPGGVKALGFMMGILGGPKLNEGDLDIDFKLKGSTLNYDTTEVK